MIGMFQAVTTVLNDIGNIIRYFIEIAIEYYQILGQGGKVIVPLIIFIFVLLICYIVIVLLRVSFIHDLRHLKNIRYEYEINLNRFKGERCSIIFDILLFQKVVLFDDKVIPNQEEVIALQEYKMRVEADKTRKKNPENEQSKVLKQTIIATIFIVIVFITMLFRKYNDFDILFRSIYNFKYGEYVIRNNIGSLLFVFGFIVSIIMTVIVWIYILGKDKWIEKFDKKSIFDAYSFVSVIPIFISIITILNAFIISPAVVKMNSMEPNYSEGDTVFISHTSNYQRFDVVIVLAEKSEFIPEYDLNTRNVFYIKRVVGLPGETITMEHGTIYINGLEFDESDYLMENMQTYCKTGSTYDDSETCSFIIPEDHYFLLGDNRINSFDSRNYGSFSIEDIYGKVVFKF
jgi:signal peptidase I